MTAEPIALAALAAAAFVGALIAALLRRPPDLAPLASAMAGLKTDLDRVERLTREAELRARDSADDRAGKLREGLAGTLGRLGADLRETSRQLAEAQRDSLNMMIGRVGALAETTEKSQQQLRESLDKSFVELRGDNAAKLEEMRRTVDEKLQDTLERRFVASFKTVSDQLESVHKGLGEMQTLATGVGDLKKLLSGVKTRGTFGEVQLGALLDQFLSPGQYERNARPRPDSAEMVEYAVRLPEAIVPIDCKFPQEDYARLLQAVEAADPAAVEAAALKVERSVRLEAKRISDKYINPPITTDFAILFLPTEGLFAEVIRRPGLSEAIQRDYHVVVTGPTTLAAFLMSLGMGFRTLAVQQRSKEVWEVLGAVKTEFANYGALMDKVGKKLQEGQNVIEQVGTRTRAIQRKLREVEALPEAEARPLLEPELALDTVLDEPGGLSAPIVLFKQAALDGIAAGSVTLAFRRWRQPRIRNGSRLRTAIGVIAIEAVEAVADEGITEDDARSAGYASIAALRAEVAAAGPGQLYRIALRLDGPDPRVALRLRAELSESDRAALVQRLAHLDARSVVGPWTETVLRLIAERPGVRAADLAARLGRETAAFKLDVRKLKELGLTESLEIGYRLSPGGRALLGESAA